MAQQFAKMDAMLDGNPRIRKAGREGREVFLFVLRRVAVTDADGDIPATNIEPWYLADQLMMTESDAEVGVAKAVRAGLITIVYDRIKVCGWNDDWGKKPMTEQERKAKQRQRERDAAMGVGAAAGIWTYVIEQVGGGFLKVGRSENVGARLATLQVGSPHQLRVLACSEGDSERALLRSIREHRAEGEWFHKNTQAIEIIARHFGVVTESRSERDCPDSHGSEKSREEEKREEEKRDLPTPAAAAQPSLPGHDLARLPGARARKPPAETQSEVTEFKNWWLGRYFAVTGHEHTWNAKAAGQASTMVKAFGLVEVQRRAEILFAGQGPTFLTSRDLGTLVQHFDKLATAVASQGRVGQYRVTGQEIHVDDPDVAL